jgi:hypothetical protein
VNVVWAVRFVQEMNGSRSHTYNTCSDCDCNPSNPDDICESYEATGSAAVHVAMLRIKTVLISAAPSSQTKYETRNSVLLVELIVISNSPVAKLAKLTSPNDSPLWL